MGQELIREADEFEGIAEPHVRDLIYPSSRRGKPEMKRWERAARFINEEDSRVRTYVRLLNGVECNVWVWVAKSRGS
uniref:Tnp_DNA_bind domain-containing protein n=1 Tax=Steinernema glaseri TaxID=37863 RepID=A0A1I7ZNA6_9BILA